MRFSREGWLLPLASVVVLACSDGPLRENEGSTSGTAPSNLDAGTKPPASPDGASNGKANTADEDDGGEADAAMDATVPGDIVPRVGDVPGPGLGQVQCDAEAFELMARYGEDFPNRPGDLSDPLSLVKGYGINQVAMHNGYLVVLFAPDSGKGPGGLRFYDVSDPRAPRLVHELYEPSGVTEEFREAHAIGFSSFDGRNYAVFHTGLGLEFWDFSDVNSPQRVGKIELPGVNFGDYTSVAWQLFWQGRYVYVAGSNQGIFIVDAGDPTAPRLVDRGAGRPNPVPISQLGGFRVGPIFTVGNLLVISSMDTERGYAVLDIGDPANPVLTAALNRGLEKFYAIAFSGNKIIGSVRGPGARMTVHDIHDPSHILLENDSIVIDEQLYAATQDEFVFQGCQEEVVKVDISSPDNYRIVGRGDLNLRLGPIEQQVGPDHGQVTPMGNMVFVGNDHGNGSGVLCHQAAPDTTAPKVNMVSPSDGAVNQQPGSRVGLTFTDNIALFTVNETTFAVRKVGDTEVLSGRYTVQLSIVNFWPDEPLEPNTEYEVIVPAGGIQDWAGNSTSETFVSRFVTAPALDGGERPENMLAHWPLDHDSGDIALDASGNEHHGTVEGTAQWQDGALSLSGEGDTVQVAAPALDFDGAVSLALWVRTTHTSTGGADTAGNWWRGQWLVDKDRTNQSRGWALTNHHGKAKFYVNEDGETLVSTSRIDDGQWHHVAAVRESSGARRLYIDGNLEAEDNDGSQASLAHEDDLFLGSQDGEQRYAEASMRDVFVFTRALTADEITQAMNGFGRMDVRLERPEPSLVGAEVTFRAVATGGGDKRYAWNFGDGSPSTSFSDTPEATHTYAEPGHYEVFVTVTDGPQTVGAAMLHTVHWPLTASKPTRSSTVAYEPNRNRVWNANPDNDTVTAVDADTLQKLLEVSVGSHPRTVATDPAGRIWVANQDDATVSVLRGDNGARVRTTELPRASRPYGVVLDPAGTYAFVSLQATGQVLKLRVSNGSEVGRVAVGPDPRGLAVSADGSRLFVTRLKSPPSHGLVTEVDTSSMTVARVIRLARDETTVDGEDRARGLPNYLTSVTLSPDGRTAWVPSKSDNILRGRLRDGQALNFENTVRAIASRIDLTTNTELAGGRIDFNDREMPVAVEFTPLGDYAYVVLQGSRKVEIRDGFTGLPVGAMDGTGVAPQGIVSTPDGSRVFLHNFMSRTLQAYDTRAVTMAEDFAPPLLASVDLVEDEQLSATVLRGKQIFYDASDRRMSRDGYISCASCHLEGDQDGRVWDFGDRGEGFRNTISLLGRAGTGHGPVHWTANFDEIQDFENDIRNGFGGTGLMSDADFDSGDRSDPLGDTKAGVSEELDALAAYVSSLDEFHPSPFRNPDGSLTAAAAEGRALFLQAGCDSCHAGTELTDSPSGARHDVGTLQPTSGQRRGQTLTGLDTPTLRGVWETAPYLHDGSAATLLDVLTTRNPDGAHGEVTREQAEKIEAYLLQIE